MRVLVIGSGVVGVTSAYYLVKAGHEVTVVDRQRAAGLARQVLANGDPPVVYIQVGPFGCKTATAARPPSKRAPKVT